MIDSAALGVIPPETLQAWALRLRAAAKPGYFGVVTLEVAFDDGKVRTARDGDQRTRKPANVA